MTSIIQKIKKAEILKAASNTDLGRIKPQFQR